MIKCLQAQKYSLYLKFSTLPMGMCLTCEDKSLGFSRSLVFQTGSLDFPCKCMIVSLWLINRAFWRSLPFRSFLFHHMWQVKFYCRSVLDEALSVDNVEQEGLQFLLPTVKVQQRQKKRGHANTCSIWVSSPPGAAARSRAVLLLRLVPNKTQC